ncbi:Putative small multi-drug export protein [Natronorubrum sediminis]|uniref:Putative small multi-drug export protein n=1 Tax=Natronorubrum sediminis TaxID=640943 RepID=A0A1H6FRF8_9EURY|nr:small multi-drug export protein [Natronorubrum sediminis]SEH12344.1 Putative small multi-drug export protein [Natronorubrum sediminis]
MTGTLLLIDVGSTLEDAGGFLQYLLVFVFAAIPVVEILVVIPVAIGVGLDPVLSGVFAFAGNVASIYVLIGFHKQLREWWHRRRGRETRTRDELSEPPDEESASDRYARARGLWERYGLPGIAVGGPILTGVHIAALVALLAGGSNRLVAGWMTVGIAAWTVVLVAGSVYGFSLLGVV